MKQPKPKNNKGKIIFPLVVDDLGERYQKGLETYGVPLQANNGRDMLIDAYEEVLDLAMYLRGEIAERYESGDYPDW